MFLPARPAPGVPAFLLLLLPLLLALSGCSQWNWREVRSAEDAWSATFPDKSQVVEREVEFGGRSLPMRMQSTGVGATLFAVGVVRLPPELAADPAQRDALLAWFDQGLVRRFGLVEVRRGPAATVVPPGRSLHAARALEARASVGAERRPGTIAARLFLVDDRLYQLIVLGAEGELPPEVSENFLSSFRLLPR